MTKHDVSSRLFLVRGFGLEGVFTGLLFIGVQRLVGTQNAEGNQVAFELDWHLGVELVKVQSALRVISMVITFARILPGSGG